MRIMELWWSGGYESDAYVGTQALASNVLIGTNPPYTLNDFLAVYPKFFGPATAIVATLAANSNQISVTSDLTSISLTTGSLITGSGIPRGTIITAVDGSTVTLSNAVTADGTAVSLSVYLAPWLPFFVIQLYINLARASLMQSRYFDSWLLAMGFYIAH
jgi:hypothetical protein